MTTPLRPKGPAPHSAHDLVESLGGVRGTIESTIPGVVFAVAYPLTGRNLGLTVTIALSVAAVILVVGLIQRRPVVQGLTGFLGVAIVAGLAAWLNDPKLFYFITVYKNAFFTVIYLGSILVRWPLIGVFLGPIFGEGMDWRSDRRRYRAYRNASWLWVGMFLVRFLIQRALYMADKVTELGLVNIVLGLPFFLAVCGGTWLIIRHVPPVRRAEPAPEADEADDPASDEIPVLEPEPEPESEPARERGA